uniref:Peptidase C1A papain C-terminal domain-containing protein n=1 Tax=Pyrodinium bahamense TaxID=73915 RepID=A0A7S0AT90_9DINO|mmetsp:Transcript_40211/g.111725  ORF Transcript_40211/g.111725 Transcript_40211/m.111725 type:complete len:402 (+) Transcript_40211:94-1299(+)|eukprot:CAMPEP_0179209662 /NCGR_PEP_ID=MMETSP0796-20121207/104566_1 /TAXON_ID=73915 /ORGANISM="Pyrodinium bahamense, Strain pbaha01" /LENGTH=401 /DNA_ID=CAMNT_0020914621 /DNA_START=32 /DNA_END=1237 /DNA_ORIENTATION=+
MRSVLAGLLVIAALRDVAANRAGGTSAYAAFRRQHRPGQSGFEDAVPFATRLALFEARRAEVEAHNALPHARWLAEVNRFADFTDVERLAMLGYRRIGGHWGALAQAPAPAVGSFLEQQQRRALAETVDWRQQLNHSSTFVRNQGACGSCWAVAAVGALEMHAEIAGAPPRELSYEQLVDCVPNQKHCGGDGGCKGATAELAFEYVAKHGLADAGSYKGYASGGDGRCREPAKTSARIQGFVRLPENRLQPLLRAVSTAGPLVVSVDASPWHSYGEGVFDGCQRDATVNHAVVLAGYGADPVHGKYFLIRNSWGLDWGEAGFIRLQRHDADAGEAGCCGTDYSPQEGVGCQDSPSEIPVCGMCGVLSDSSYPTKVRIADDAGAAALDGAGVRAQAGIREIS